MAGGGRGFFEEDVRMICFFYRLLFVTFKGIVPRDRQVLTIVMKIYMY